jgi:zincin-like metallopeptidase
VAELGAAFLFGHLNIRGELRHAKYIATWIKVLKARPPPWLPKAAEYLRGFSQKLEEERHVDEPPYVKRLEDLIVQLDATFSDLEAARRKSFLARDMPLLHRRPTQSRPAGMRGFPKHKQT